LNIIGCTPARSFSPKAAYYTGKLRLLQIYAEIPAIRVSVYTSFPDD
jgi:hypothetical protein